ncbi:hypothetical protein L598_002200000490 [Mesorhizobium sp. J18]|uniref:HugZ family pyridoxamine 5'-phosphate oxidase n=1 Tax=Mesorhizobium sp. J18 TaxID=935263 RepID=UPI001198F881|nr:HugZ family protein [Mesorhizobium sp. J18]TWG97165.1 hypothetical protein L598_002200000490 [Mesorhizobium sp. J18]
MTEEKKDVIQETDEQAITLARSLIRSARYGALATLDPETGAPMATRVAVATDLDAAPLILVSALSAHTAALLADPRCSLLLGEPGRGDPLAHPRITLHCRAEKLERGTPEHIRAERRYLNRQPKAKLYASFNDFSFFRLEPTGASLNGGFARAYLLKRSDLVSDSPALAGLEESEQRAIDHMNSDHSDAVAAYARHFAKAKHGDWKLTGIDPEGIDIASGDEVKRIDFAEALQDAADVRKKLVEMARQARDSA